MFSCLQIHGPFLSLVGTCDSEVFLLLVYLKYGRSGKTKDYIKLIFPASALNTQHKKERPKTG